MRYILTLLLGAIIGGALVWFFFLGAPRMKPVAGTPVRAPEPGGDPPGTAVLTLDEQFFATLLGTMFKDLDAPTFKLAALDPSDPFALDGARILRTQGGGCQNQLVIAPEGSGVQTGVRLQDGRINVPLAFNGSRDIPFLGCQQFRGAAQANIQLNFDAAAQTLSGRINVEGVNVENVAPAFSGLVTQFVQNAIDQRVNPLTILRGQQLGLSIPMQNSNGTVRARARDVRSEVKDGKLHLHVTYDFGGVRGASDAPPASTPPAS
ncbi:MAG TPA: hypothetical protein VGV59_11970 [Pyrinomonadaceae bacterium]|nr:hypothetical protein [Pyrinomonadaceae bacterium]